MSTRVVTTKKINCIKESQGELRHIRIAIRCVHLIFFSKYSSLGLYSVSYLLTSLIVYLLALTFKFRMSRHSGRTSSRSRRVRVDMQIVQSFYLHTSLVSLSRRQSSREPNRHLFFSHVLMSYGKILLTRSSIALNKRRRHSRRWAD